MCVLCSFKATSKKGIAWFYGLHLILKLLCRMLMLKLLRPFERMAKGATKGQCALHFRKEKKRIDSSFYPNFPFSNLRFLQDFPCFEKKLRFPRFSLLPAKGQNSKIHEEPGNSRPLDMMSVYYSREKH